MSDSSQRGNHRHVGRDRRKIRGLLRRRPTGSPQPSWRARPVDFAQVVVELDRLLDGGEAPRE
jgi:hypothetical protein